MSKEHDNGYFQPEKGDRIGLAGNFNNWRADTLFLTDENGDWIFSIPVADVANKEDTLQFKFKIQSGEKRIAANSGWEGISNRKIAVSDLIKDTPVFVYNEVYDKKETIEITFTVGTSNQQLLGFFYPQAGDRMVVSGSFCGWEEDGILLSDDDGDKIYSAAIPIRHSWGEPIQYKFKIIPNRKTVLLNQGWENLQHREFIPAQNNTRAPYAEFDNTRRAVRFIINAERYIKSGLFKPLKGDILQINLFLDDKEKLSNPLIQISQYIWEASLIIPMTVKTVKWRVVKNQESELTTVEEIKVPVSGAKIES
jgi:hypothetical protein